MIRKQVLRAREHSRNDQHTLLTPRKEHDKLFPKMSVIGFRNDKSLKDYLVRPILTIVNEGGRCEPCGKKACLVCGFILNTATIFKTEACQETKLRLRVVYYYVKFVMKIPKLGKRKPNDIIALIITTLNTERSERVIGKFFKNYITLSIASMATVTLKIGIL